MVKRILMIILYIVFCFIAIEFKQSGNIFWYVSFVIMGCGLLSVAINTNIKL